MLMPSRRDSSIILIMRNSVSLDIPPHLIDLARLFAPGRPDFDAVCHLLEDYPRLVSDVRKLRKRLDEFDSESSFFDQRLEALQSACLSILEL